MYKTNCVSCNEKIQKKTYEYYGNYCRKCCSKAHQEKFGEAHKKSQKVIKELFKNEKH